MTYITLCCGSPDRSPARALVFTGHGAARFSRRSDPHHSVLVPDTRETRITVCIRDAVVRSCTGKAPSPSLRMGAPGWDAVSNDCTGYRWIFSARSNVVLPAHLSIKPHPVRSKCAVITYDPLQLERRYRKDELLSLFFAVEHAQYVAPSSWQLRAVSIYEKFRRVRNSGVSLQAFLNSVMYKRCRAMKPLTKQIGLTHCQKRYDIKISPVRIDHIRERQTYAGMIFLGAEVFALVILVMIFHNPKDEKHQS